MAINSSWLSRTCLAASAFIVLALLASIHPCRATPMPYIPPSLAEWTRWIQERHPEWSCSRRDGQYACVFPGNASFAVSDQGATMHVTAVMLREDFLPLPSAPSLFPAEVTVSDQKNTPTTAPILLRDGIAGVWLPPGTFSIQAKLFWNSVPSEIPVPTSYGLITAGREGKPLTVERSTTGIRIRQPESSETTNSLSLEVIRRFSDGSPLLCETRLRIRVSGKAREVTLGQVIPANATPIHVLSPLGYTLTRDGNLTLQLLPGLFDIDVTAAVAPPVAQITAPVPTLAEWPTEETWIWVPQSDFRTAEVSGLPTISVEMKDLPQGWASGAAYVVKAGETMHIDERQRGELFTAPNDLQVNRSLWTDIDGNGYTVVDRFTGTMNRDFRLNAVPGLTPGRATAGGSPQLVSKSPTTDQLGIEVRDRALNLEVVSRLEDRGSFSAVGWDSEANSVLGTLHVPPSWRLIDIQGATSVQGAWLRSWTLLSIFLSVLMSLATWRLLSPRLALAFGLSLILNHGEFLSPGILYIEMLILIVLQRIFDDPASLAARINRGLLWVTFGAWTFQSLSFAKLQLSQFLYPQLEAGTRYRTVIQTLLSSLELSLLAWPFFILMIAGAVGILWWIVRSKTLGTALVRLLCGGVCFSFLVSVMGATLLVRPNFSTVSLDDQGVNKSDYTYEQVPGEAGSDAAIEESYEGGAESRVLGGALLKKSRSAASVRQAQGNQFTYQNKTLLAGPAVPSWRWRSYSFSVAGPVPAAAQLHPMLLPPMITRSLSLIRFILSLALVGLLFPQVTGTTIAALMNRQKGLAPAAGVLIALWASGFVSNAASADVPSPEILKELEQRLGSGQCQGGGCATIEEFTASITDRELTLAFQISNTAQTTIRIPGPLGSFGPQRILRDGAVSSAQRAGEDGFLQVFLGDAGRHHLIVSGPIPDATSFPLRFADLPLRGTAAIPNWVVEGIAPTGNVQETIRFIKKNDEKLAPAPTKHSANQDLPTWATVNRTITVAENISALTRVVRLGSVDQATLVKIPLQAGERVVSGAVLVEGDSVVARFAPQQSEMTFASVFADSQKVSLTAQGTPQLSESWSVRCSPLFHCTASGLRPTATVSPSSQEYSWLPYPGESATVAAVPLEGVAGSFLTVDSADYTIRWGTAILDGNVILTLRTTKPTSLNLVAPPDSEIRSVTINGQAGGSTWANQKATVLLEPGNQSVQLTYVMPWVPPLLASVPPLSVSAPLHNIHVKVSPSADRWLWFTGGPTWGPSVLFWPKLLMIILLCITLTTTNLVPLSPVSAAVFGAGIAIHPLVILPWPLLWLLVIHRLDTEHPLLKKVNRYIIFFAILSLSLLSLTILYSAVRQGLLFAPPMLIAGNGSTAGVLHWFTDVSAGDMPRPWVVSLPMWSWRAVALAWSTWMAVVVMRMFGLTVTVLKQVGVRPVTTEVEQDSTVEHPST